jgi:hypothetical protein
MIMFVMRMGLARLTPFHKQSIGKNGFLIHSMGKNGEKENAYQGQCDKPWIDIPGQLVGQYLTDKKEQQCQ